MTPFPRFYPILDAAILRRRGCSLRDAAAAMIEGGARILQLRVKDNPSQKLFDEACAISDLCRRYGILWIVNDRADLALLTGAGLHVGQDDLPAAAARTLIGDGPVLGLSTHNPSQMRAATLEPVDYAAIGPVYATTSKENPDPSVGLEGIAQVRMLTNLPLIAIGGITRATAGDVLRAGADSAAIIGDLYPGLCDAASLRQRVREWLRITG